MISKVSKKLIFSILIVAILIACIIYYYFATWRFSVHTDNAYVQGNLIQVMPQVSGTVSSVLVNDTDFVRRGQSLILLDNTDANVALAGAKASLADTVRQINKTYQMIDYLNSIVQLKMSHWQKAKTDFARRQALAKEKSISDEDVAHAKTAMQITQADYEASLHQLRAEKALLLQTDIAHQPPVLLAQKNLETACLNLQRTVLFSPVTGYIAHKTVQLRAQVTPSMPLLFVVPLDQIWIEANFKESQLKDIRIGQPVNIIADTYGKKIIYKGIVAGVSPGTGGVFSLLPPQNATGNWIKVVQRVPVRITFLDKKQLLKYPLSVGMSVNVTVDTHQQSGSLFQHEPVVNHPQAEPEAVPVACQSMIHDIILNNTQ